MNYFDITDRTSQSRLKKILVHPRMYMSKNPMIDDDDKIHFTIGNGVDCLMTEPEKFNELFYILSTKAPTGQIKQFIDAYYKNEEDADRAFEIVNSAKYKIEWFKAKLEEDDNKAYFNCLKEGKTILDPPVYETITQIVKSFAEFKEYQTLVKKTADNQIVSQLEIMWSYKGLDMKSKLDFIVIDYNAKTILPIDVKTVGDSTMSFQYSFWKRRYDFQAASYTLALKYWIEHEENFSALKDFTILPFHFAVESSKYQGSPLIFKASPETMEIGLNGGNVEHKTYEGLNQAIDRLKWHTTFDVWDYTMEQWETDKTITI